MQKTCYRKEDLSIPRPPSSSRIYIDNGVPDAVRRSLSALTDATDLYGAEVIDDVQLGFSKPISLQELRAPNAQLPLVADCIPTNKTSSAPSQENVLSVVVSYRHTTEKRGYILNVNENAWRNIASSASKLCEAAGRTAVRLWTDQILSCRKPAAALRWVSSGVLPYAIYPVLYLHSDAAQLRRDLRRMWISVEHLMAAFGQGLVHVGHALEEDELPLEWPTTFVSVQREVNWMVGLGLKLDACVLKLCSALMCGLVRNKEMSWPGDAQDLLDWASAITCSLLHRDIAHSFDCDDCRVPLGFTSRQRLITLYSTAIVINPHDPEVLRNETHPRLDVPALSLEYEGRTWDGFREWVPESCLWGLKRDETKEDTSLIMKETKALVMSHGGSRAVAIVQFCKIATQENVLITAYLLVGLIEVRRGARRARVEWSKRFWPVFPLRMWRSFEGVWRDLNDREAFVELVM
ncbi:hypothetical protein FGB62_80g01 [Gracilaria domingensis]|nr:hypothetical protein FGB62_80g01 [Gracilaria domingensis]